MFLYIDVKLYQDLEKRDVYYPMVAALIPGPTTVSHHQEVNTCLHQVSDYSGIEVDTYTSIIS